MTIEFWCIAVRDETGEIAKPATGLFPTREAAKNAYVGDVVLPEGHRLVICTVAGLTITEWDFNES